MAARAILWDLDGTLVDSADHHWRAWRETMQQAGVDLTRAQFDATFGQRNDVILARWLGDALSPDQVRQLGDDKEICYRRLVSDEGVTALPGAEHWIHQLEEDGWMQAIASSAPRRNVEVVLQALVFERYFRVVVAAEDVRHGKPEPDVFLTAADRLSVSPDRCVVVEDAAAGVEAARRAGMVSVMVGTREANADVVVASLEDLHRRAFDRLRAPAVS